LGGDHVGLDELEEVRVRHVLKGGLLAVSLAITAVTGRG
jgi:hypothetical protein